ncbi:anaerobic ribonucleoside-triphosphate reductase activating protein [Flavicella sp.]|uniref:anaerobic ribonucleoside-triphosphate reductase activating protein n=1 Tax=Flavicella sp. TaxID=2957742 RepID=UPI003018CF05
MYYHDFQVVIQEVPGEISLCFSICGCKLQCKGCHSSYLWKEQNGKLLLVNNYIETLNKYSDYASCVLFMGGEWHSKELIELLKIAKYKKYKTCLYTGETSVSKEISNELTFLKTGKWTQELGGLESESTNQIFKDIIKNKNLNYLFSNKNRYDTTHR